MTPAPFILALLLQPPPEAPQPPPWAAAARHTGVSIDRYDRRIEGAPGPDDQAYEATVRNSAALAQGRAGVLDGGWTLVGEGGAALYEFQLAEPGSEQPVEGVWRRLEGAGRSWGFFALIGRDAGGAHAGADERRLMAGSAGPRRRSGARADAPALSGRPGPGALRRRTGPVAGFRRSG